MNAIVRRARPDDAIAIAAVHVAAWRRAYKGLVPETVLARMDAANRAERWRDMLQRPGDRWWTGVSCVGPAIHGFATVILAEEPGGQAAELSSIYVAPDSWRQGHGRLLLCAAFLRARDLGLQTMFLWVLDGNRAGRSFYEAASFAPDGGTKRERFGDVELDEVRYRCAVP